MLGMPIVHFMIVGDMGSALLSRIETLKGTFWASHTFPILAFGILFSVFILKREITELKSAGYILLFGVVLFVAILGVKLVIDGTSDISFEEVQKPQWGIELIANVPTIFLSYAFQCAFFPAYQALKNKNDAKGIKLTVYAFVFVVTVYLAVSIEALLKYGRELKEDVLENVSKEHGVLPYILDGIFLIIVSITTPVVFFVGKESLLIIFDELLRRSYSEAPRAIIDTSFVLVSNYSHRGDRRNNMELLTHEGKQYLTLNPCVFYFISIAAYVGVVCAACFVHNIKFIFGLIGSTAGSFMIFVLPSAFYLRAATIEKVNVSVLRKAVAWLYMLSGTLVFLV